MGTWLRHHNTAWKNNYRGLLAAYSEESIFEG